jgi:hypothetical protein
MFDAEDGLSDMVFRALRTEPSALVEFRCYGDSLEDVEEMALALESELCKLEVIQTQLDISFAQAVRLGRAFMHPNCRLSTFDLSVWLETPSVKRVIDVAFGNAKLFQRLVAIRSSALISRIGRRCALRKLPKELLRMMADLLVGFWEENEEEEEEEE